MNHTNPDHGSHDRLLVAAFAAGDLTGADRATAARLTATCVDCAALARDLQAISVATATLPAPARPRDFRLTQREADRIRPRGLRGVLSTLAAPRLAFTKPLATGLMTLGIVGVLINGMGSLSMGFGSAGAAPVLSAVGGNYGGQEYAASPASGRNSGGPVAAPQAASESPGTSAAALGNVPGASGKTSIDASASGAPPVAGPVAKSAPPTDAASGATRDTGGGSLSASGGTGRGQSPLFTFSVACLLVGATLFLLRRIGRVAARS